MANNKNNKLYEQLYWLIPVILVILQAIYFNQALIHIRQEELTESVSNIFWFQKGNVCSGLTTSVGWYGQLMVIYNLFGFSLATVKIYKLFLVAISLFCLASILKNFLGAKKAWFPLLVIGLSPTYIYFNSLSIHYGMDLVYFPICLYLVLNIKFETEIFDWIKQIALWTVAMVAWMSYPSFIYYLPVLFTIFIYKLFKKHNLKRQFIYKTIILNIIFFLLPLVLAFLYVNDKNMLIYDPKSGTGLFRGNGSLTFDLKIVWDNLQVIISDLFYLYSSYYFEIAEVEFSGVYPIIPVLFVLILSFYSVYKNKKLRLIILGLLLYLVLTLILTSLTFPLPGIRRATIVLAIFYSLFVFSYYFVLKTKWKNKWIPSLTLGVFSLLLIHNVLAFQSNLEFLKRPTDYKEGAWFYIAGTPQKSLNMQMDKIQKEDLTLICIDKNRQPVKCGGYSYNLIYPAIAGSCLWNNLNCHQIKKYDFEKKELVPISLDCWSEET